MRTSFELLLRSWRLFFSWWDFVFNINFHAHRRWWFIIYSLRTGSTGAKTTVCSSSASSFSCATSFTFRQSARASSEPTTTRAFTTKCSGSKSRMGHCLCRLNNASTLGFTHRALHMSGMEDMLLYIASCEDERQFSFHVLEIVSLMFREQPAEQVAAAGVGRSESERLRDEKWGSSGTFADLRCAPNWRHRYFWLLWFSVFQRTGAKRGAGASGEASQSVEIPIEVWRPLSTHFKINQFLLKGRKNCFRLFFSSVFLRHSRFGGTFTMKNCKSISDNDLVYHRALNQVRHTPPDLTLVTAGACCRCATWRSTTARSSVALRAIVLHCATATRTKRAARRSASEPSYAPSACSSSKTASTRSWTPSRWVQPRPMFLHKQSLCSLTSNWLLCLYFFFWYVFRVFCCGRARRTTTRRTTCGACASSWSSTASRTKTLASITSGCDVIKPVHVCVSVQLIADVAVSACRWRHSTTCKRTCRTTSRTFWRTRWRARFGRAGASNSNACTSQIQIDVTRILLLLGCSSRWRRTWNCCRRFTSWRRPRSKQFVPTLTSSRVCHHVA